MPHIYVLYFTYLFSWHEEQTLDPPIRNEPHAQTIATNLGIGCNFQTSLVT